MGCLSGWLEQRGKAASMNGWTRFQHVLVRPLRRCLWQSLPAPIQITPRRPPSTHSGRSASQIDPTTQNISEASILLVTPESKMDSGLPGLVRGEGLDLVFCFPVCWNLNKIEGRACRRASGARLSEGSVRDSPGWAEFLTESSGGDIE